MLSVADLPRFVEPQHLQQCLGGSLQHSQAQWVASCQVRNGSAVTPSQSCSVPLTPASGDTLGWAGVAPSQRPPCPTASNHTPCPRTQEIQ